MIKVIIAFVTFSATADARAEIFTLYRSSAILENARLHVATFDAAEDHSDSQYNRSNCEQAADLFQHQPGVRTRFWCESGRFHN